MILFNVGANKNEIKRSEEGIDTNICGILLLQKKFNKR